MKDGGWVRLLGTKKLRPGRKPRPPGEPPPKPEKQFRRDMARAAARGARQKIDAAGDAHGARCRAWRSDAKRGGRAVGTDDPAGFFLEFGTSRSRASPWLVPALRARLPGINHAVRKVIAGGFEGGRQGLIMGRHESH
jgi:hypothetical protein